jgi:tubulin polyglutamylase TTLL6/13
LLYGTDPLHVYIYDEGMARFATEMYQYPNENNMDNMFMHLTNYAINKKAHNYEENENEEGSGKSHKRSLK